MSVDRLMDVRLMSLDELVLQSATIKAAVGEYAAHQLEVPDRLVRTQRAIAKEIEIRRLDVLEKRLAAAKARAAALTPEEKKLAAAEAEIAELEAALNPK